MGEKRKFESVRQAMTIPFRLFCGHSGWVIAKAFLVNKSDDYCCSNSQFIALRLHNKQIIRFPIKSLPSCDTKRPVSCMCPVLTLFGTVNSNFKKELNFNNFYLLHHGNFQTHQIPTELLVDGWVVEFVSKKWNNLQTTINFNYCLQNLQICKISLVCVIQLPTIISTPSSSGRRRPPDLFLLGFTSRLFFLLLHALSTSRPWLSFPGKY